MKKISGLNIGCGGSYSKLWTNIDLNPSSKEVINVDIRKKLPFKNNQFQYAYSSHVLEHLTKNEAYGMVSETYRVLKKNGIFRIAVPNLENIASEYLKNLKLSLKNKKYIHNYKWILLELYDQTVRTKSGGNMLEYMQNKDLPNKEYILNRVGMEAKNIFNLSVENKANRYINFLRRQNIRWILHRIRYNFIGVIVFIIGGRFYLKSFEEGVFRNMGEVHKNMYDRLSLKLLLESVGFHNIRVVNGYSSAIPNFDKYELDISSDGGVRKPDSLFVEATKK